MTKIHYVRRKIEWLSRTRNAQDERSDRRAFSPSDRRRSISMKSSLR